MDKKIDVQINIYGGNNQILPNADKAVQNFFSGASGDEEPVNSDDSQEHPKEHSRLLRYVESVEKLRFYLKQIGECETARELAGFVTGCMLGEPKINKDLIVKKEFISMLIPFAVKIKTGKTVDNIRARINTILTSGVGRGLG